MATQVKLSKEKRKEKGYLMLSHQYWVHEALSGPTARVCGKHMCEVVIQCFNKPLLHVRIAQFCLSNATHKLNVAHTTLTFISKPISTHNSDHIQHTSVWQSIHTLTILLTHQFGGLFTHQFGSLFTAQFDGLFTSLMVCSHNDNLQSDGPFNY